MSKWFFICSLCMNSFLMAAGDSMVPKKQDWSFSGPFGTFDRASAQRGFQVFQESCSACHSINFLRYRDLAKLGFSEAEIKVIAAEREVEDGPNDEGEMFNRPAEPGDIFFRPYPNEQAARAANDGSYPVDLSLITKARVHGADYLYSILTGYEKPPKDMTIYPGKHYNPYFPGGQIAMPEPLIEGQVTYHDGTEATLDQMAHDVTVFLSWAAEPEMEERKRLGVQILISLLVLFVLLVFVKRAVWRNVK